MNLHIIWFSIIIFIVSKGDPLGFSMPEPRADYINFTLSNNVYVPGSYVGHMGNGDAINSNTSTFLSLRSKYINDPKWGYVNSNLIAGVVPQMTYHRFWGQSEILLAFGMAAIGGVVSAPTPTTVTGTSFGNNQFILTMNPAPTPDKSVTISASGSTTGSSNCHGTQFCTTLTSSCPSGGSSGIVYTVKASSFLCIDFLSNCVC